MKSIQTKILTLILSSVLAVTLAVVLVSVVNYSGTLRDNSEEIMILECMEKKGKIDEELRNVEQAANTIYYYALAQMGSIEELWQDEKQLSQYIEKVKQLSLNVAENTEGAVSVYSRFNPQKTHPKEGFFLVEELEGTFWDHEITELLKFHEEDIEHECWYYTPINNGKATWIGPYYNKNIGLEVVSYVIPVFQGETEVGVIGMDIAASALYQRVDEVSLYETGYAFLTDEEINILHHKSFPDGIHRDEYTEEFEKIYEKNLQAVRTGKVVSYKMNGINKVMVARELHNGMLFAVCAEETKIITPQLRMIHYSLLLVAAILFVVFMVTVKVVKAMVSPLKQLTEAAKKIAKSELDFTVESRSNDEIGILAKSIMETAEHLKEYIGYINRLAYIDVLTGLGNNAAYKARVRRVEETIVSGNAEVAVCVVDINNLKPINDNYGHESGDLLIKNAADVLRTVWDGETIYRIGGDEFVVVCEGNDFFQRAVKLIKLEEEIEKHNVQNKRKELCLQMGIGMAVFNKETDKELADVFRRADVATYEDKAKKKTNKRMEIVN